MKIEFISYRKLEDGKHLGIATVSLNEDVYLSYKVVPNKSGNGYFISPATYKIEEEKYLPAFSVDRISVKNRIEQVIRENIKMD